MRSAPPESASNFPMIAPSAIRTPTPATVPPTPVEYESSTCFRDIWAILPTISAPMVNDRKACSLNLVMRTMMTVIPTRAAISVAKSVL